MIRYHTPAEVAAVRADSPDCWVCEIVLDDFAALLAIPSTPENAARALRGIGNQLITGAMLDGACLKHPRNITAPARTDSTLERKAHAT